MGALAHWQARSTFRRLPAEQLELEANGIDWRKADGTKDHPVWASVPIETEPSKYDPVVLLALNFEPHQGVREHHPITPWLALSVLGGHTSKAASEGCHSIAQLIMSDLQTSESMGDDMDPPDDCLSP